MSRTPGTTDSRSLGSDIPTPATPAPPDPPARKAFAALAVRDYRIYLSTGLVSNIGAALFGAAEAAALASACGVTASSL
ncbi:hypothetical protein [Catenulispora rubra]|uniref:hypothetical protein n=1 Tax=Catenulispora rubra TaxID=280293 RepID=UPI0018926483|nr:hypothetical protein [Catenulispora rubra]